MINRANSTENSNVTVISIPSHDLPYFSN